MFIDTILESFNFTLTKNRWIHSDWVINTNSNITGLNSTRSYNEQFNPENFLTKLTEKKNELNEIMNEWSNTESKYINKKWIDEVDNIEKKFKKYLEFVEILESQFQENNHIQQDLKFNLQSIKQNIGCKMGEIESLELDREWLLDVIKKEGL